MARVSPYQRRRRPPLVSIVAPHTNSRATQHKVACGGEIGEFLRPEMSFKNQRGCKFSMSAPFALLSVACVATGFLLTCNAAHVQPCMQNFCDATWFCHAADWRQIKMSSVLGLQNLVVWIFHIIGTLVQSANSN